MASLACVSPILPDKEEAWRRFYQELSGSRRKEYEQSRQQLGITRERAWISQTAQREIAIVYLEVDVLEQIIQKLVTSDLPFDRWFRQQMMELHGLDVMQFLAGPPNELIFVWQAS